MQIRIDSPGGFTVDEFTVDHEAGLVTCPNGLTHRISARGHAAFGAACTGCPLRQRCTRSRTGKSLKIGPHDALQRAARTAVGDQVIPQVERSGVTEFPGFGVT